MARLVWVVPEAGIDARKACRAENLLPLRLSCQRALLAPLLGAQKPAFKAAKSHVEARRVRDDALLEYEAPTWPEQLACFAQSPLQVGSCMKPFRSNDHIITPQPEALRADI